MTLKQVVKQLNQENPNNNFKLTPNAAKRSRQDNREWVVVRFQNSSNWRDFSPFRIILYEALPPGWPLTDVCQRLGCSLHDLKIVAKYNPFKKRWENIL